MLRSVLSEIAVQHATVHEPSPDVLIKPQDSFVTGKVITHLNLIRNNYRATAVDCFQYSDAKIFLK